MPYVSRDQDDNVNGFFELPQPGVAEEYIDSMPDIFNMVPNISGFKADMVDVLGGIVQANNLLKAYPVFLVSLSDMKWNNVSALVVDAHANGVIDAVQYAAFKAAFGANNIPITLP